MEVERLVEMGVLKRINHLEWAAPSFIIPKKDGTTSFFNDFRELNKRIRRKPYPIPNIQEMLLNLEGFQCGRVRPARSGREGRGEAAGRERGVPGNNHRSPRDASFLTPRGRNNTK